MQRIASATSSYPGPGNESLYDDDNHDFAVRAGFAYSLAQDSRIVLRGGFGIFYDRPFDNLWLTMQANNCPAGAIDCKARISIFNCRC